MRKRKPNDTLGDDDDLFDAADDPALRTLKNAHGSEFKQAFQAAVADLPARDRGILRAMIVDDRGVNEIAVVYGVHRVTASRWVSEIRHALLKGTRAHLRTKLRLDDSSLDSAIRMIDSNLDMSLYRLLHDAA
jgi:RNA polymerase sigma-70 factor (ECF subfamily)